MKLIRFYKDQDWGQDYYLQLLFTKHWALFQGSVSWCEYPGWPFLQIQSGLGSLLKIVFNVYRFGISVAFFDRTWDYIEWKINFSHPIIQNECAKINSHYQQEAG